MNFRAAARRKSVRQAMEFDAWSLFGVWCLVFEVSLVLGLVFRAKDAPSFIAVHSRPRRCFARLDFAPGSVTLAR